jgi:hypothetical protein
MNPLNTTAHTDTAPIVSTNTVYHIPKHETIDPYAIERDALPAKPFIHPINLRGPQGIPHKIRSLFDDGAMVNSMCTSTYKKYKDRLGALFPSRMTLRMANGAKIPSQGQWTGDVDLVGLHKRATFEVFPSGGNWSLLFGKPLLQQYKAIHNYKDDTLSIPHNGGWRTILNDNNTNDDPKRPQTFPATTTLSHTLQAAALTPRPIAAGVGLSWRREHGYPQIPTSLVNDKPPGKEEKTHTRSRNAFAPLAGLEDTILGETLDRANNRPAYLPPELQGYRMPRRPAGPSRTTQLECDIDGVETTQEWKSRRKGRRDRRRRTTSFIHASPQPTTHTTP